MKRVLSKNGKRLTEMETKLLFTKFNRGEEEPEEGASEENFKIAYGKFIEEITPRAPLDEE